MGWLRPYVMLVRHNATMELSNVTKELSHCVVPTCFKDIPIIFESFGGISVIF